MSHLRVIVSGMVAGVPGQGGAAWAVLQYVLGLRRLGHDVLLLEPVHSDSLSGTEALRRSAGYFADVCAFAGIEGRAALIAEGTRDTVGLPYERARELARDADVLLNVSGMLADDQLIGEVPVRVYLDLDPAFNQLWDAGGIDMRFGAHNRFVTVGQRLGTPGCPIPDRGRHWIGTVPPVVLESWPRTDRVERDALTTVGHWRGYGSIEHEGLHYGQKAHSLRQFMQLPTMTDANFVLAMEIHEDETKDLEALAAAGWQLVDPMEVAGTPAQYRNFVQGSWAEFGVAKSGYVVSESGWFSDRSACYLASGRPVIAQETGFSDFLPTGEGLFAFRTPEDVLSAIEELRRDYARHSSAARRLAEERLDSDQVLARLLEAVAR